MGMLTDLEQRVLDAVGAPPAGHPPHGLTGAMKWRVDSEGPGGAPRWEGGYVCYCGTVFARPAAEGGIKAALGLYVTHEANP